MKAHKGLKPPISCQAAHVCKGSVSTGVTWSKPRHLLRLTVRERRRELGRLQGGLGEGGLPEALGEGGAVTSGKAGADTVGM